MKPDINKTEFTQSEIDNMDVYKGKPLAGEASRNGVTIRFLIDTENNNQIVEHITDSQRNVLSEWPDE